MKEKSDNIPLHILPDIQFLASDQIVAFGEHRPSHRINFFAIIWFSEDKGEQFIDFETYPVRKNLVYLISKNQIHSIPASQLPKARVIVFSTDFFHRIDEMYLRQLFLPFENNGIEIPEDMVQPLQNLFSLILLECASQSDTSLLLKYTTAFLQHLYRFAAHRLPVASGEDTRIVKLLQLVEQHFKENRSASFYAGQIGLTPKRMNEILRKKAGITINQLVSQLLLIESKRELFHGDFSIKEIAYSLGFTDQSYFARFFRKHTGTTPELFRRQAHL
jgi:AraC family transcriptional activator of pobA